MHEFGRAATRWTRRRRSPGSARPRPRTTPRHSRSWASSTRPATASRRTTRRPSPGSGSPRRSAMRAGAVQPGADDRQARRPRAQRRCGRRSAGFASPPCRDSRLPSSSWAWPTSTARRRPAQHLVLAYASYAIAARDGNREHVAQRDAMASVKLDAAQARQGASSRSPTRGPWASRRRASPAPVRATARLAATTGGAPARNRCSAAGRMEGEKFAAGHCAVSLYGDQHSVAIWFNEEPITPEEAKNFQVSSYASGIKGGKLVQCCRSCSARAEGSRPPPPLRATSIDLNTNHANARSPACRRSSRCRRTSRSKKMAGEIRPGAPLSAGIVGKHGEVGLDARLRRRRCLPRTRPPG